MLTEAEILFERFCNYRSVPWQRIPECSQRTPDYEITLSGQPVAVEVKQIEPNASDLAFFAELRTRGSAGRSVNTSRAQDHIRSAAKQLRAYAKGKMPALAVLYDTMGLTGYLDPYSIARCLYGPERVHFAIGSFAEDDVFLGMSHGPGRVATRQHNTSLSGVAVIQPADPDVHLNLFHNRFAEIPLEPNVMRLAGVRQFVFSSAKPGLIEEWQEV